VSDIAQLKMLDGRPATFLLFNGPDRYVVLIDGEERTITLKRRIVGSLHKVSASICRSSYGPR
jgi:hypothetical protein